MKALSPPKIKPPKPPTAFERALADKFGLTLIEPVPLGEVSELPEESGFDLFRELNDGIVRSE